MATLKNRNDLQAEAAANLPDNTTQAISPQDVRQMAENLAESNFNKITDGPLVGLKPYNTGVIYETGQGANYLGNLYFANKTTTLGAFVAADWDLFASNVSDLNDLSDVATGLPGTPTIVDDTKLLFYDKATSKFITDDIITAGTVVINAKKSSAGTIAKGKPVYLVGFDSDLHTVEEANAGAVGTMPVIGFAAENMDATNAKKITTFGKLTGLNTSAFSLGADLYISTTTGTLTATRPTGAGSFIQRVAKVLKSAASGGQLFIFNTARAAGLPNLAQNNVWMGDANGQPQAVNKSTIVPTDAQIEIGYNNQVPEVTQSEAEAGTVTTVKRWTPQRVKQAIDALASGGDSIYTANGTVPSSIIATLTNTLRFKNGAFEIQGAGTTTGTTLALYDNDSTPTKTWDWLDSGDVVLGQNANFVGASSSVSQFKFYRPANGVGFGSRYDVDLKNSANEQTSYANFGGLIVSNTNGSEYGKAYIAAIKNGTTTVISYFDSVDGLCIENVTTSNLFKAGDLLTVSKTDTTIKGGEAPLNLYRSSSGVTFGSRLDFSLNNSSNVKTAYGDMFIQIVDNTAGLEDGSFSFRVLVNGTKTVKIKINTNLIEFEDNLDMKNNRILNTVVNPTVQELLGGGTFTINADQQSDGVLTAMSASTTIAAPTGTPVQSQDLVFRFKDDGTARALTWNAVFRAIGVTLPTTTTASKLLYVGCKYNSTDSKWDVIAVQQEA